MNDDFEKYVINDELKNILTTTVKEYDFKGTFLEKFDDVSLTHSQKIAIWKIRKHLIELFLIKYEVPYNLCRDNVCIAAPRSKTYYIYFINSGKILKYPGALFKRKGFYHLINILRYEGYKIEKQEFEKA